MAHVLALDGGSTTARAAVLDADGAVVEGTLSRRSHGGVDDPDELAAFAGALAAEALRRGPPVDAAGVSCFWHSLVALDARGRPLTPVLGWRGDAAAGDAVALARRLGAGDVHRRTGCPLHASFWPAKLAWLRRARPEVWREAARFVSFAEVLHTRLSGDAEPRMSLSSASGTGLLGVGARGWDAELLDALALDPARLPEISDAPAGGRAPWFPALGDGACANLGAGCVSAERAAVTVGTSAAFRTLHAAGEPAPRPGLFLYRLDGERVVEGGSLSEGGNLRAWLLATLRLDGDPDALLGEARDHGLVVLPRLGGERAPGWDARARGTIHGLTFETTAADVARACLEAVALSLAEVAARMPEVEQAAATGGALARSRAWTQLVADALGLPVARPAVVEASLRGAGVAALERLGAAPAPPPAAETLEPRPAATERLRAALERRRELRRRLDEPA